jgi:hypothetical protein
MGKKKFSQGSQKVPAGRDSFSRLGSCISRLDRFSNLRHPWLALQETRVNPRSAQISAELPK